MRKIILVFFLIFYTFPSVCFSLKNPESPKAGPHDTVNAIIEIRDISLKYSASVSGMGKLRREMYKVGGSLTNPEEFYYLKEIINTVQLTIAVTGYQKLMLYQYPDLQSKNNIHIATLKMALHNTKNYLDKYFSSINFTLNQHIYDEECKMLIEECLLIIEELRGLTQKSEDIINKDPQN